MRWWTRDSCGNCCCWYIFSIQRKNWRVSLSCNLYWTVCCGGEKEGHIFCEIKIILGMFSGKRLFFDIFWNSIQSIWWKGNQFAKNHRKCHELIFYSYTTNLSVVSNSSKIKSCESYAKCDYKIYRFVNCAFEKLLEIIFYFKFSSIF